MKRKPKFQVGQVVVHRGDGSLFRIEAHCVDGVKLRFIWKYLLVGHGCEMYPHDDLRPLTRREKGISK